MFCSQCSEFIGENRTLCPSCGHQHAARANGSSKPKHYCRRCERYLLSKICPIHGTDHVQTMYPKVPHLNGSNGNGRPQRDANERALPFPGGHSRSNSAASNGAAGNGWQPVKELFDQLDNDATVVLTPPAADEDDDVRLPWHRPAAPEPASRPAPATPANDIPAAPRPTANGKQKAAAKPTSKPGYIDSLKTRIEKKLAALRSDRGKPAAKPRTAPQPAAAPKVKRPAPQPAARQKKPRSKMPWVVAAMVLITLGASAAVIFDRYYPQYLQQTLYTQAETQYTEGDYAGALQLYEEYAANYPFDPNIEQIKAKINNIHILVEAEQQKELEIYGLMEKASQAFAEGRYLLPEADNAAGYVARVLKLDPQFAPAREMQSTILTHYWEEAEKAFDADQLDVAIENYRKILQINPDDQKVVDELERALKIKNINDMLGSLSELAQAKEELKRLQREKYRLKTQVQQERRRLQNFDESVEDDDVRASLPEAAQPTAAASSPGLASSSNNLDETLGIMLIADAKEAGQGNLLPRIVEETLIDGGKKRYVHREKPDLPAGVSVKGVMMILAECIVGVDGQVEQVQIVSPSANQKLNQLAEASFHKYQFKPATYQGEPVRFKSIEVMTF